MKFWWKIIGEYFFIVGLSLTVSGAIVIFSNPGGIIFSGIILFLVGFVIKLMIADQEEIISNIPSHLIKKRK